MELVHPEDRNMVRQQFTEQLKVGTYVRLEHRILHKNGTVRWVYNNSRLITTASGEEVIHSYLLDIQDLHREDTALQEKLQRYEMILAQTENVLFEWDMEYDTVTFSDTWEKVFGYQVPGGDGHWSQQWMDCLYPDDMPLLADCFNSLKNGSAYEMREVRMATARGSYLWCRFRATAVRDNRGNLRKISGIIINIDAEKQAERALQNRAEQDSLTKLLNKDTARKLAEDYFSRYADNGGALMILDLDDFKRVNDEHGHLFGDSVLIKVAQEIRKMFRGQDIVARIGGDEFMVVMRGVTDQILL
jgi:putative two-component system response regulator